MKFSDVGLKNLSEWICLAYKLSEKLKTMKSGFPQLDGRNYNEKKKITI